MSENCEQCQAVREHLKQYHIENVDLREQVRQLQYKLGEEEDRRERMARAYRIEIESLKKNP